jgi:SAM-dependent methyltransferase
MAEIIGPHDCLFGHGAIEIVLHDVVDNRLGTPGNFAIAQCPACQLMQTVPRPDQASLNAFYERYYNFGGDRASRYSRLRERLFASVLYRLWLFIDGDISFHRAKGAGRLIDIGCNEGRGLERYRANGFEVEGQEPNPIAAANARSRGFTVVSSALTTLAPDRPYNVAVLSNVLEHALDPRGMLAQVHRILAPSGELWLSLPNARSAFRALFGRHWINWHVPYHIVHFTAPALRRLLTDSGFEIVRLGNATPSLWVAQSMIAAITSRAGKSNFKLRKIWLVGGSMLMIRGLLFPFLWLLDAFGRGDCLVVRARKAGSNGATGLANPA